MDASDFDSKEAQLKTLARVIRCTDDCMSDFSGYELRYDKSRREACARQFDNDHFRDNQQPYFNRGIAQFEDFSGFSQDFSPAKLEEVEELYLFDNPINFDIL